MTRPPEHVAKALSDAERIARLSDRVVGIGPFNFGLDALFTLLPVAGGVYTAGAGAWMIGLAVKAGASPATMAKMAAYVAVDVVFSEIPVLGDAVDILFPGHILAAKALRKDIEARHGPMPEEPRRRWWSKSILRGPASA